MIIARHSAPRVSLATLGAIGPAFRTVANPMSCDRNCSQRRPWSIAGTCVLGCSAGPGAAAAGAASRSPWTMARGRGARQPLPDGTSTDVVPPPLDATPDCSVSPPAVEWSRMSDVPCFRYRSVLPHRRIVVAGSRLCPDRTPVASPCLRAAGSEAASCVAAASSWPSVLPVLRTAGLRSGGGARTAWCHRGRSGRSPWDGIHILSHGPRPN